MEKVVIIDAASMINRYYYASIASGKKDSGNPDWMPEPNQKGYYNNALEPFLIKLMNLQKMGYTKIAICIDYSHELLNRREMYPEYKENRTKRPIPLSQQLHNVGTICKKLGFQVYGAEGIEADDFAGTLTRLFLQNPDTSIDIITGDHDYLQLIACNRNKNSKSEILLMVSDSKREEFGYDNTVPSGMIRYGVSELQNIMGLKPRQIIDYKAICGDSSDNYPGIKGVSEKTAIPLLQHYGTLEAIYVDIDAKDDITLKAEWKALGISRPNPALFRENRDMAFLCKDLARIDTHVNEREIPQFKETVDRELTDMQREKVVTIDTDMSHYDYLFDTAKLSEIISFFNIDITRQYEYEPSSTYEVGREY